MAVSIIDKALTSIGHFCLLAG